PVRLVIDAELFQQARREQAEAHQARPEPSPPPEPPAPSAKTPPTQPGAGAPTSRGAKKGKAARAPQPTLFGQEREPAGRRGAPRRGRRWHRLADFVVGACNRVAHASALSVVEAPGEGPNPLVLYGPVGTGKTHLLEGIAAGLRRSRPDWRVLY